MESLTKPYWLLSRRWLLGTALVVAGLVILYFTSAYPRGMLTAWADHSGGHYEIQSYGKHGGAWHEYDRLLRDRYGVVINRCGCEVDWESEHFAAGYNDATESRLKDRFGKDIFAECWAEAEAQRKREKDNR